MGSADSGAQGRRDGAYSPSSVQESWGRGSALVPAAQAFVLIFNCCSFLRCAVPSGAWTSSGGGSNLL